MANDDEGEKEQKKQAREPRPIIQGQVLLDYDQAARFLGLPSRQALADLKRRGNAPRHTQVGRRTMWSPADMIDWADQLRRATPILRPDCAPRNVLPQGRRRGRPSVRFRQAKKK